MARPKRVHTGKHSAWWGHDSRCPECKALKLRWDVYFRMRRQIDENQWDLGDAYQQGLLLRTGTIDLTRVVSMLRHPAALT